jgi:hypothetical protein
LPPVVTPMHPIDGQRRGGDLGDVVHIDKGFSG